MASNNRNLFFLQFWWSRSLKSGALGRAGSVWRIRGEAVLLSPSSGCLRPAWLVAALLHSLPSSSHSRLPIFFSSLCKLILRTLGVTFGPSHIIGEPLCLTALHAVVTCRGKITFRGSGKMGHDTVSPRAPDLCPEAPLVLRYKTRKQTGSSERRARSILLLTVHTYSVLRNRRRYLLPAYFLTSVETPYPWASLPSRGLPPALATPAFCLYRLFFNQCSFEVSNRSVLSTCGCKGSQCLGV